MVRVIRFQPDGTMVYIHDEKFGSLFGGAPTSIGRASNVEPEIVEGKLTWTADLILVKGPRLTGFATRDEALAAEVTWLNRHGIPMPA